MEVVSRTIYPTAPAQQQDSRPESNSPVRLPNGTGESGREEYAASALPLPDDTPQTGELPAFAIPATPDSRQLVLQSRYRQAEAQQEPSPQREAYRVDSEPLRIQQALGAYRNASGLADEGGELMPRLDSYV